MKKKKAHRVLRHTFHTQSKLSGMKIEKNIDKCGTKGLSGFSERGNPFEYKQISNRA